MDSGIAGLEVRVGIVWFVVGLRGCNKEDCDHWVGMRGRGLVVGLRGQNTEDRLGGIAWLSIHRKTLEILGEMGLRE